jgi:hypothetical protein
LKRKTQSFYILGYRLNLSIKFGDSGKKKKLKSGKFGHFSQEKSFAQVEIIYFRHENSSSKVTLTRSHPTALLVQHRPVASGVGQNFFTHHTMTSVLSLQENMCSQSNIDDWLHQIRPLYDQWLSIRLL